MYRQARESHEPMKGWHLQSRASAAAKPWLGPACHLPPAEPVPSLSGNSIGLDWHPLLAGCRAVLSNTCTKFWFFFLIKAIHRMCVQIWAQGPKASRLSGLVERERNLDWGLMDTRSRPARQQGWAKPWCCATVEPPRMTSQRGDGGRGVRKSG